MKVETNEIMDALQTSELRPNEDTCNWQLFDEGQSPDYDLAKVASDLLEAAEQAAEDQAALRTYPEFVKTSERINDQGRIVAEGYYEDDPGDQAKPNSLFIKGKKAWTDPMESEYHKRIEERRKEIWEFGGAGSITEIKGGRPRIEEGKVTRGFLAEHGLGGFRKTIIPDKREKLIEGLIGAELNRGSFLSQMRIDAKEEGIPRDIIEKIWQKMSVYKMVKDMLVKPQVVITKTSVIISKTRRTEVFIVDDYGNEVSVMRDEEYASTSNETKRNVDGIKDWSTIHRFFDGKGAADFIPRMPKHTLFLNPDGSRYLSKVIIKSPIQAKQQFCTLHKIPAQRVSAERVVYDKGSPILRQLNLPDRQTSINVISIRKLTNESKSSYCDTNPNFIEKVNEDGEWVREYQWTSGLLINCRGKDTPNGAHVLSVRDYERALLAGADFSESDGETGAAEYEHTEESGDDRLKSSDELPRKDTRRLSEDERELYNAILAFGDFNSADMMTIDFDALPVANKSTAKDIAMNVYTKFMPTNENPNWVELKEDIYIDQLHRKTAVKRNMEIAQRKYERALIAQGKEVPINTEEFDPEMAAAKTTDYIAGRLYDILSTLGELGCGEGS